MRAISRRTGLKHEIVIDSAVSSMIRSMPVAASSARTLRPSRPISRPFRSSDGSGITATVRSCTNSLANRWIAVATIVFARAVGLALRVVLDPLDLDRGRLRAPAPRTSSSSFLRACVLGQPGDLLELLARLGLRGLGLLDRGVGLLDLAVDALLFLVELAGAALGVLARACRGRAPCCASASSRLCELGAARAAARRRARPCACARLPCPRPRPRFLIASTSACAAARSFAASASATSRAPSPPPARARRAGAPSDDAGRRARARPRRGGTIAIHATAPRSVATFGDDACMRDVVRLARQRVDELALERERRSRSACGRRGERGVVVAAAPAEAPAAAIERDARHDERRDLGERDRRRGRRPARAGRSAPTRRARRATRARTRARAAPATTRG